MAVSARRWLPFVIAAVIAIYVAVHIYATHSEAFEFVNQTVRKSSAIRQRVGDVQQVRLGILDRYSEKSSGSNKRVKMTVSVVGDKGTVKVDASVKKTGGVWSVTDASIGGEPAQLKCDPPWSCSTQSGGSDQNADTERKCLAGIPGLDTRARNVKCIAAKLTSE